MLHSQVSYQVHPNPCSTDGTYPALGLDGVLVVDVAAEADEVEVLAAEWAVVELRPAARVHGLVPAGVRVVEPHVQIIARLQAPHGGSGGSGGRRRGRGVAPVVGGVHGGRSKSNETLAPEEDSLFYSILAGLLLPAFEGGGRDDLFRRFLGLFFLPLLLCASLSVSLSTAVRVRVWWCWLVARRVMSK